MRLFKKGTYINICEKYKINFHSTNMQRCPTEHNQVNINLLLRECENAILNFNKKCTCTLMLMYQLM